MSPPSSGLMQETSMKKATTIKAYVVYFLGLTRAKDCADIKAP
jgi:hypothetical protein